jgi:alpha-tubulin suppressor-like RCC1 family protein
MVTDSAGSTASTTVTFGAVVSRIATGYRHACQISSVTAGQLKCWGENVSGEIGDGTTTERDTAVSVDAGNFYSYVAAGTSFTCALDPVGNLFCWGENAKSQLGDGTTTDRTGPTAIDVGTRYSAISAGGTHACGVTTTGVLKCWGDNGNSQVGDGTLSATLTTPTVVDSGVSYTAVSAGTSHTCGITTAGALKCWGLNSSGQLGIGSTSTAATPATVQSGVVYTAVAAGAAHTCAIAVGGVLKCWGDASKGQVGDGTATAGAKYQVPYVVDAEVYTTVAAGLDASCAIRSSGALYCWGENGSKELGDGTTNDGLTPTAADSSNTFSAVSMGASGTTTCGLTTGGTVRCWGAHAKGQAGHDAVAASVDPDDVDNP